MAIYFNSEHPKDALVFYIATPPNPGDEEIVGTSLDSWSDQREWVIKPPLFVHQTEDVRDPRTDLPVVTLGGFHEFYAAYEPWRSVLPLEVDRQHCLEFEFILERLTALSLAHHWEWHLELNGQFLGTIRNGQVDPSISDEFLRIWKRGAGIP